jgi:hypothetical protein
MRVGYRCFVLVVSLLALAGLCACGPGGLPKPSGEYLGQTPPGDTAELFAPGFISTGLYTRDVAITPDGKEFYFSVVLGAHEYMAIMVTQEVDGHWTEPVIAPFSGKYKDLEPAISPDGQQLFFLSFRPLKAGGDVREDSDIWVMDRVADGWGEPTNLGLPVNTDTSEYFPSVTADGTLYFTRDGENRASHIYNARRVGNQYTDPVRLGEHVNATASQYNSFVAPDESYLIFAAYGAADSRGASDYYISFRDADDNWTGPFNMGDRVNTAGGQEYSPYVTLDGKYLFFMAARSRFEAGLGEEDDSPSTISDLLEIHAQPRNGLPEIYWIDAGFIEGLRPE